VVQRRAWAMKYRYQYGLGYRKATPNWGKDAADPRNAIYEGRPDPVPPDMAARDSRCLAARGRPHGASRQGVGGL